MMSTKIATPITIQRNILFCAGSGVVVAVVVASDDGCTSGALGCITASTVLEPVVSSRSTSTTESPEVNSFAVEGALSRSKSAFEDVPTVTSVPSVLVTISTPPSLLVTVPGESNAS